MKHCKLLYLLLLFSFCHFSHASGRKEPMTFEQMIGWERITDQKITDNGEWIACKMQPWQGDSRVLLYNKKGEQVSEFTGGDKFIFSAGYLVVSRSPLLEVVEELKLKKVKKDQMPSDQLILFELAGRNTEEIDSVMSFKVTEAGNWLAYQSSGKDSVLYIRNFNGNEAVEVPDIKGYGASEEANVFYYITSEEKEEGNTLSRLMIFTPEKGISQLYEGEGEFKQVAISEKGDQVAFLYCPEKKPTFPVNYALYLSENGKPAQLVADRNNPAIPSGWIISSNGKITFSKNGGRLYFGTAPEPLRKDTTVLDENRPKVEVWNWNEEVQYTQQKVNKKRDTNRSYRAVYNKDAGRIIQLATEDIPELTLAGEADSGFGLLTTSRPYGTEFMWNGKNRYDTYRIDLNTGEKELITEGVFNKMQLSPQGKYAYWYNITDSCWYTFDLKEKRKYQLTTPASFAAWNEDNDVPDYPRPHGIVGWSNDDLDVLLYDRYDVWRFNPCNLTAPQNVTVNGRSGKIRYRWVDADNKEVRLTQAAAPNAPKVIDLNQSSLLRGFNEVTKGEGFYVTTFSDASRPIELISGNFKLRTLVKAKGADRLIYSRETFEHYPDLYLSDMKLKKSIRLTDGARQQEGINWGTAELVSWISLDGQPLEGVIYKPANFDPAKKYPLIVNFYERNSETLYNYRMPEPHRSTIDYHFYNSNGYIIFNPDIRYKVGTPGEDCYNCIMPGISKIIEKGYVDEKAIGAQGHSWGGYQVAYLATRTSLFAAIESGAPVVNMYSAYGGIRWETGRNRSFQYELGQSRIGKTMWEAPLAYLENSPLFTMDKVTTPILIMHNDNDGHVPWYQGIEYFIALKRLQKPAWLLNYPGDIHWPASMANRIDFQKRMYQFFEHYLNGKPMPKWMEEGIPAVKQEYDLGYE